jgi:4-hydroxybenzoate polyprenyltransferase
MTPDNHTPYTDIKREGWVRHLPPKLGDYALLMRLDRPVGWWLLLLPGWWGIALGAGGLMSMTSRDWSIVFLFLIGAILMRGAGCIVNDLWDRELDQKVERTRTRPLASGRIKVREAAFLLLALLLSSLLILLQMPMATIALGVISLLPVILYPLMKRITWWPQAFLGITFNVGALMGFSAATGYIGAAALLLYAAGFFWTMGYDTIYAYQDKADDELAGIKSTARLFGDHPKKWLAAFYSLTISLFVVALMMTGAGLLPIILLSIPAAHFVWQVATFNPFDQHNALKRFKSNRIAGFLLLIPVLAI